MLFSRENSFRLRDNVRVKVVVAPFATPFLVVIPILIAFVFFPPSEEFQKVGVHFVVCL